MAEPSGPQEQSYLDHSRDGRGQGGWYLLGLLVILFVWIIFGSFFGAALGSVFGVGSSSGAPWQVLLTDLAPFALLFAGVLLVVRYVLGRPARTVVTGRRRVSVRRILYGAVVFALLSAVGTGVDFLVHRDSYTVTFTLDRFIPIAIVAVLLIPIQSAAEELLFRGYLVQWTSLGTGNSRRPLTGLPRIATLAAVSGLLFALPHLLNPEAQGAQAYAWLAWFALGAGWAWAAVLDGRIELGIGAHIANNLFSILAVGYSVSVVPTASAVTTNLIDWPLSIVSAFVIAVLFVLITCRGLRPRAATN